MYHMIHQELYSFFYYAFILLAITLGKFLGEPVFDEDTTSWMLLLQCLAVNDGMMWWYNKTRRRRGNSCGAKEQHGNVVRNNGQAVYSLRKLQAFFFRGSEKQMETG